jgi:hypothetical protein
VDRDAIARERRRREALDALEFERDRESALRDQVDETVLEEERARVDREAFARMQPEDADIVRDILGDEPEIDDGIDEWDDPFAGLDDEPEPEDDGPTPDEVARLLGEIDDSRSRQHALERFVEALEQAEGASGVGS